MSIVGKKASPQSLFTTNAPDGRTGRRRRVLAAEGGKKDSEEIENGGNTEVSWERQGLP